MAFLVTAFIVSGGGLAFVNFSQTNAAVASKSTVSNWWPTDNGTISGTQPFQAVLNGWNIDRYEMYWSVDNGTHNKMTNNYDGSPHKLSHVNVDTWTWNEDGKYTVTFIAKQRTGAELGRTAVVINTKQADSTPATVAIAPVASTTATSTETTTDRTSTSTTSPTRITTNTLVNFFVDPSSQAKRAADSLRSSRPTDAALLDKIANSPGAKWFGGWNTNMQADVNNYVTAAQDAVPVLVAYNVPQRDCGSYSAGGASSGDAYLAWIQAMAAGIGSRDAWIILEPDALAGMDCLNATDQATRLSLLSQAVTILSANPKTRIYIDAGHARWKTPTVMAERLKAANVANADGFSLNVSNFLNNSENITYGQAISSQTGAKPFVIDTSRNGLGPTADNQWCNPAGRALGSRPTANTGNGQVAAYLWIKAPGESDGSCNGGPSAGSWWTDYALGLASRAAF